MTSTCCYSRTSTLAASLALALAACSPQAARDETEHDEHAETEASSAQARGTGIDSFDLPRDLEIELAMSALPPHLRDQATIYVLDPARGFEVARQGTNGFHAFVARTGDDAFDGSWELTEYPRDIIYPVAFDEPGARANMRVFFDAAELQARGTPPAELKRQIQERYRTGYYQAPDRAGVSYMLSPILRTYVNPVTGSEIETSNNPHVMYLAPSVSNREFGGVEPDLGSLPFIVQAGPHGFIVQHLGEKEREEITRQHAGMLKRLCELNSLWCLPGSPN